MGNRAPMTVDGEGNMHHELFWEDTNTCNPFVPTVCRVNNPSIPEPLKLRGLPEEKWNEVIRGVEDGLNTRLQNEFTFLKPMPTLILLAVIWLAVQGGFQSIYTKVNHLDDVSFNTTASAVLDEEVSAQTDGADGAVVIDGSHDDFAAKYDAEQAESNSLKDITGIVLGIFGLGFICYHMSLHRQRIAILEEGLTKLNEEVLHKVDAKIYYLKPRKQRARVIVVEKSFDPLASWREHIGEDSELLGGAGSDQLLTIKGRTEFASRALRMQDANNNSSNNNNINNNAQ